MTLKVVQLLETFESNIYERVSSLHHKVIICE